MSSEEKEEWKAFGKYFSWDILFDKNIQSMVPKDDASEIDLAIIKCFGNLKEISQVSEPKIYDFSSNNSQENYSVQVPDSESLNLYYEGVQNQSEINSNPDVHANQTSARAQNFSDSHNTNENSMFGQKYKKNSDILANFVCVDFTDEDVVIFHY